MSHRTLPPWSAGREEAFPLIAATLVIVLAMLCRAPTAFGDDATVLANCPVEGDTAVATVQHLNVLKRRMTIPSAADMDYSVTMAALTLPGDDTTRWNAAKGATIEGYVAGVKVGGVESVNCHTHQTAYRDTHIELTLKPNGNDETTYVIVEVTPQVRQRMAAGGTDWSTATLRKQLLGKWIQVTGWLLFDLEHAENAANTNPGGRHNWRATVWEVHPITSITVLPGKPK
jgi:hypothetical protein